MNFIARGRSKYTSPVAFSVHTDAANGKKEDQKRGTVRTERDDRRRRASAPRSEYVSLESANRRRETQSEIHVAVTIMEIAGTLMDR